MAGQEKTKQKKTKQDTTGQDQKVGDTLLSQTKRSWANARGRIHKGKGEYNQRKGKEEENKKPTREKETYIHKDKPRATHT